MGPSYLPMEKQYSLGDLGNIESFKKNNPHSFFIYDEEFEVTRYYVIGFNQEKCYFFSVGMITCDSIFENYFCINNGIPTLGLHRILNEEGCFSAPIHKDLFEDEFNSDFDFILLYAPQRKQDLLQL
jgi:hypothetical protein